MDQFQLYVRVNTFLAREAQLLDAGKFEEWYATLDEEIDYIAPLRHAVSNREDEVDPDAYRYRDNLKSIRTRIDRLKTGFGFAEMPYSRTTRSVSSVLVGQVEGERLDVSSTIILYRHRGTDQSGDTLHARRNDVLRIKGDDFRLLRREVIFSEVSLSTPNLGIFF